MACVPPDRRWRQAKLSVRADSKELGMMPTFNTIAEIRGSEKPNEYVILSADFDRWYGGSGVTDMVPVR